MPRSSLTSARTHFVSGKPCSMAALTWARRSMRAVPRSGSDGDEGSSAVGGVKPLGSQRPSVEVSTPGGANQTLRSLSQRAPRVWVLLNNYAEDAILVGLRG